MAILPPVLTFLGENNKKTVVYSSRKFVAGELIRSCGKYENLTQIIDKIV